MLPHSAGRRAANVRHPRSFGNQSCGRRLRCLRLRWLRDLVVGSCYQMLRTHRVTSRASSPGPETSRSPEIRIKLDRDHWIGDRGQRQIRLSRLCGKHDWLRQALFGQGWEVGESLGRLRAEGKPGPQSHLVCP